MRVAAIQMCSTPDKETNLAEAYRWLLEAVEHEVNCVAFPENFALFTQNPRELLEGAESVKGPTVETLQEWAAEHDVWIVAGSLPILNSVSKSSSEKKEPRLTNTCLVFSPEGEIHARYDKIHLFDATLGDGQAYLESRSIRAGKKVVVTETAWGNWGLSICYDIRFPELYRRMLEQDPHVLFIPSAFTSHTGKAHWDVLTRARAIENQAFVVAPAQFGSPFPGRECHGHTRIVDPWGRVLAERAQGPGVVWADLTTESLEKPRRELPALKNRRL